MTAFTIGGGTIVTATGRQQSNLLVDDGRIAHIGTETAGAVIDATGLLVLPGMVDTHVDLMDPGDNSREDFVHGTRAAAARGVTTIVEHTHSNPIKTVPDLEAKLDHVSTRANVDYGLAAHVWPDQIDQIGPLAEAGVAFFKIFTCTTHGVPAVEGARLEEALGGIARSGSRCLIHNEDEGLTASAERRLRRSGRVDPGLISEWRSREAELVAIASTAGLVAETGAKATFAHVSNPGALDVIDVFRRLGADVAAEACPQYLALDEDEVVEQGALRKFTPPARIRSDEERSEMWAAVTAGRFSHFSTDHAPSTLEQKQGTGFWEAPFGLPGLDTTLPFLLDAAIAGHIDLSDVVRLYATAPAARYRLPKGVIAVGADADLVLVDPNGSWTVRNDDIISKAGWTPYAGRTFMGEIVATYLRGEEVGRDGRCHDLRTGEFLRPTV